MAEYHSISDLVKLSINNKQELCHLGRGSGTCGWLSECVSSLAAAERCLERHGTGRHAAGLAI